MLTEVVNVFHRINQDKVTSINQLCEKKRFDGQTQHKIGCPQLFYKNHTQSDYHQYPGSHTVSVKNKQTGKQRLIICCITKINSSKVENRYSFPSTESGQGAGLVFIKLEIKLDPNILM